MKKHIITILFMMVPLLIFSQEGLEYKTERPQIILPSPQSQLFEKYVNQPVTEYNGIPDINIPLYEIKIKGVTIPISLSYHAGGIKYQQDDGDVGLGWTINAGGYKATRTVYGREDDIYDMYDHEEYQNTDSDYDAYLMKIGLLDMDANPYQAKRPSNVEFKPEDGEYDQFTYMLPTSNGHFIISDRKKGKVTVIGENLDIVQLTTNSPRQNSLLDSIRITDKNGINYFLGGKKTPSRNSPSEYLIENAHGTGFGGARVGWPLKKITNQSNQSVFFNYKPYHKRTQTSYILTATDATMMYTPTSDGINRSLGELDLSESLSGTVVYDQLLVENIKGKNEIITFHRDDNAAGILNEITIKTHDGFLVKKVKFNYSEINLSNWHQLLKSIEITVGSESQLYQFQYYDPPKYGSKYPTADQWGYYSNNSSYKSNYPTLHEEFLNGNYSYIYSSDGIVPNMKPIDHMNAGDLAHFQDRNIIRDIPHFFTLRKIVYPTGGTVEFEYESNTDANNKKTGGLRINRITHKAESSLPIIKEYRYKGGVENIRLETTDFINIKYYLGTVSEAGSPNLMVNSYNKKQIFSMNPFIQGFSNHCTQYKEVAVHESDMQKNSRKIVSIYDIPKQLDLAYFSGNATPGKVSTGIAHRTVGDFYLGAKPVILHQYIYDSTDSLKEVTSYKYKTTGSGTFGGLQVIQRTFLSQSASSNTQEWVPNLFESAGSYIHTDFKLLESMTKSVFDDNGNELTIEENYTYDSKNQISKKTIKTSTGLIETNYKYPYNYHEDIYKKMVSNNIIAPIIEEYTINNNKEIQRIKSTYYQDPAYTSNLIVPHEILVSRSGINNLTRELSYDRYDEKGNILQYTGLDGIPYSYLWSYNYMYPIAEIKNVDYETIKKQGQIDLIGLSKTLTPSMGLVDELRSTLPSNSIISTYTYRPLAGLLSTNDPKGIKTYYEYHDKYGRLKEVRGNDREMLTKYDYHYFPYEQIEAKLNVGKDHYINYKYPKTEFNINPTGGSGKFTYSWSIKDEKGSTLSNKQGDNTFLFTFYNEGQYTLTCIVKDTESGKEKDFTQIFQAMFNKVSGNIKTSTYAYYLSEPATFDIDISGGSGNFNYSWILKDATNNILKKVENQTSSTFTTNFTKDGSHNLVCIVKDTKTEKVFETSKSFNVSALKLNIIANENYLVNDAPTFDILVEKGSGSYSYKWYLKDGETNTLIKESTSKTFKVDPLKKGRIILGCTVKDLIRNEEHVKEIIINVFDQRIKIENISERSDDLYANISGTITLNTETKITISCSAHSYSDSNYTNVTFGIGGHTFSTSDKHYSDAHLVTLPKGSHTISIEVYDPHPECAVDANVSIIGDAQNSIIEYPNSLSISFYK